MPDDREAKTTPAFGDALGRLGPPLLGLLTEIEGIARRIGGRDREPPMAGLEAGLARLRATHEAFRSIEPPEGLRAFAAQLSEGAHHAECAAERILEAGSGGRAAIPAFLTGMHEHCLAQAALFPLRRVLPPLDAWLIEAGFEHRLPALAETPRPGVPVGFFNASNRFDQRGGFTLFVPEDYRPERAWPLVVALHGGFGHGGDFVWTWLRAARARGWLLLAPTSLGSTWSLQGPDVDAGALDRMLDFVAGRWNVDPDRRLLTGLSDGATYTLLHGLRPDSPFTHLAPGAGVLHPQNFVNGNLWRAAGRRIRLLHGTFDWMFPVALAREAARILEGAGAQILYDEIDDVAHAWPGERNGPILEWVDDTTAAH